MAKKAKMKISDREFARHIIEFDPQNPKTFSPHTVPPSVLSLPPSRAPIPWPPTTAPTPVPLSPKPSPNDALPKCDYLVVTWTEAEAACLADTLTPGFSSQSDWYYYKHLYSKYVPLLRKGAPALESKRLASYFLTTINGKRVLCMKSELHLSQDGPKMPIKNLWIQLIQEVQPKLVLTTGTAGGIGSAIELGDVAVAPSVQFDCQEEFKSAPFHNAIYPCSKLNTNSFSTAEGLFKANLSHLPPAPRAPRIFNKPVAMVKNPDVVTTDFFAFDDTANTYGLQGLGAAVEMGDAVLGLVIKQLGSSAPLWCAVRNASDPQMNTTGLTPEEVRQKASQIYERYGYWTTISSAITCWALILDN
jgi:phosphorylase superfamily protein